MAEQEKEVTVTDFEATDTKQGLTTVQVQAALDKYGPNEIPVSSTPLYILFLRQFVGFLPFLIELAMLIALAVQDWVDFGIIFGIMMINAILGFREEYHAKKSLDEISNSLDSEVAVRRNGETNSLSVKELVPGDIILLVGGTSVPADTKWIRGDTMQIDTAALTGEPLPRKYPSADHGDVILSGTTVVGGECYGQVLKTGTNTEIGQAQADVMKDKSIRVVSVFQHKIMIVVQILVSGCLMMVLAVLLVEGFYWQGFQNDASKTILDALSILIASIPIALPLVLQVNLALGASFMAREHHAIVTSIPALQDIASMSMLCSDKTGTLTTANMSIITSEISASPGFHEDDVILYAFLCSNADKKDDPIDRAIVTAFHESSAKAKESEYTQTEIIGFNPTVKRVVAFVEHNGKTFTLAKGLPAKILDTEAGGIDNHELQWQVEQITDKKFIQDTIEIDTNLSKAGYKTIGIAVCEGDARTMENPVWKFAGLLPMLDPPRADTKATINSLHLANISVKMITGDHVNVGKETARLIGLGTDIRAGEEVRNAPQELKKQLIWEADGFASVLPSDKREVVLCLRNDFGLVTGMTGDGVNDAVRHKLASFGIHLISCIISWVLYLTHIHNSLLSLLLKLVLLLRVPLTLPTMPPI
jgi:H+-transporting ATPase